LEAPGAVFAQPGTDRSLTAITDKPAPAGSATIAAPAPDALVPVPQVKIGPAHDIAPPPPAPDVSTLTREELEARVKTLTDALATANADSEAFRQKWTDLKLRDEALGVPALTGDEAATQERLVDAVSEFYRSEMRRREAVTLLDKLLTTTEQLIATAPNYDPKVRADYEVTSRAARSYLQGGSGAAIPVATTLSDARVADSNPDLNAVILNLGKNQGVKEGMPFRIFRNNEEVGLVKVVLARDQISAAQVQSLRPNTVLKVGDRATVSQ
jgi:hypothetical protein